MITKEQADRIEAKLDRILNTFGIRETLSMEERHKVETMKRLTSPEDIKAHNKLMTLRAKRNARR